MHIWKLKARAKDDQGTIRAVQLTEENVSQVALWCGGQRVQTYNPILKDEEGEPGINYPGRYGMERLQLRDYLMETDFPGQFRRVSPTMFESVYERA